MTEPRFTPGQRVTIRDAFGKEHPAIARSRIEGTHDRTGHKIHDFPVVWVDTPKSIEPIPWPVEDVWPDEGAR